MASFIFGRSNKFKYSALMRHDALACSVVLLLLLAQEFSSRDPSSDALRAPVSGGLDGEPTIESGPGSTSSSAPPS